MKKWIERLEELDTELTEWTKRYDEELDRQIKSRSGLLMRFIRPLSADKSRAAAEEARRAVGDGPLVDLSKFLDELCDHFLGALPDERARIRAQLGMRPTIFNLLWGYVTSTPEALRGKGDGALLERGLAAVAIHDFRTDVADVQGILGNLWLKAAKVGIDPGPHFAQVAGVANRSAGGGAGQLRITMAGFAESAWFEANVKPQVKRRGETSAA